MQLLRCACPQCGTTLRVKDRAYLGRPVPCPDCRTRLVLKVVDADHLEAVLADVPAPEQPIMSRPASKSAWSYRLQSWATNVTVISWAATFVVAVLIGNEEWARAEGGSKKEAEQSAAAAAAFKLDSTQQPSTSE